jgi:ELWxxDGT repeat protein
MKKKLPFNMIMAASALTRFARVSFLSLFLFLFSFAGYSQSQMIKDVNTVESYLPIEYRGLTGDTGGNLYFINRGKELWKSNTNESPQRAVMLKSMRGISSITVVGNNVFFVGEDGAGRELWKTNGTGATTRKVREIRAGSAGSNPVNLTNVNGLLYFAANDGTTGNELWKSDGTEAGTVRIKDIYAGAGSSNPAWITEMNGVVYFAAGDPAKGIELWKSDGTSAGTTNVREIHSGATGSNPTMLTNLNGTLFFSAQSNTKGYELWKSNGTAAGTAMVKDIHPGAHSSNIANLVAMGDFVYFSATNGSGFYEVWKSNGTSEGTTMVTDWNGEYKESFGSFNVIDDRLYFIKSKSSEEIEYGGEYTYMSAMCWSDGTAGGTEELHEMTDVLYNLKLVKFNNAIYFLEEKFNNDEYRPYLMLTRLDPYGSHVRTFYHFFNMVEPQDALRPELVSVNNALYFFAIMEQAEGYKLLKSDGTSEGTVVLIDTWQPTESANPDLFVTANGKIVFRSNYDTRKIVGDTRSQRDAVWSTNGTTEGTELISDMEEIMNIINAGALTYFTGINEDEALQVWVTDGTGAGTRLLKEFPDIGRGSGALHMTVVNGVLYFASPERNELWKSTGTPSGTVKLKDFHQILYVEGGGGRAIFYVVTSEGAHELWRSSGTTNSTAKLRVISNGSGLGPGPRTNVNEILYFVADDGVRGSEVWRSDGTTSGTYIMHNLRNDDVRRQDIASMTAHNHSLYFCAESAPGQYALYKSNGTSAGTALIKNVNKITYYMSLGERLLYFVNEAYSTDPTELWITNGSAQGTSLLKVIDPDPEEFFRPGTTSCVVNDVLFFALNGPTNIWRTDGTECGTFTLDTPPQAYPVAAIGTDLIFGALDPYYGREPYRLSTLAAPANPCGDTDLAGFSSHSTETNSFIIYSPNPFTDGLVIRVNGKEGESAAVQISAFTGEAIETISQLQTNTDHTIGAGWPKGIYVLTAVINGKSEVARVVKK